MHWAESIPTVVSPDKSSKVMTLLQLWGVTIRMICRRPNSVFACFNANADRWLCGRDRTEGWKGCLLLLTAGRLIQGWHAFASCDTAQIDDAHCNKHITALCIATMYYGSYTRSNMCVSFFHHVFSFRFLRAVMTSPYGLLTWTLAHPLRYLLQPRPLATECYI